MERLIVILILSNDRIPVVLPRFGHGFFGTKRALGMAS